MQNYAGKELPRIPVFDVHRNISISQEPLNLPPEEYTHGCVWGYRDLIKPWEDYAEDMMEQSRQRDREAQAIHSRIVREEEQQLAQLTRDVEKANQQALSSNCFKEVYHISRIPESKGITREDILANVHPSMRTDDGKIKILSIEEIMKQQIEKMDEPVETDVFGLPKTKSKEPVYDYFREQQKKEYAKHKEMQEVAKRINKQMSNPQTINLTPEEPKESSTDHYNKIMEGVRKKKEPEFDYEVVKRRTKEVMKKLTEPVEPKFDFNKIDYDSVPKIKVIEDIKDDESSIVRVKKASKITGNIQHVHHCPDKILLSDESKKRKDGYTWEERHPQRIFVKDGKVTISPKTSEPDEDHHKLVKAQITDLNTDFAIDGKKLSKVVQVIDLDISEPAKNYNKLVKAPSYSVSVIKEINLNASGSDTNDSLSEF